MRLSIFQNVRFLFFSVALLLLSTPSLSAQPKLSVDKTSIEAGTLYSGEVFNARWIVKNTGTETLNIEDVHTSCGCTSAKIPKKQLLPGEFDTLDVTFNSSNFHGKVSKYIEITSNDPNNKSTTLTLTAEVAIELEPVNGSQVVWLGSASIGKEIKHNVLFRNTSDKTITVNGYSATGKDVRGPSGKITVKPLDTLAIPLIVVPSKEGYAEEKLTFKTDSKRQSLLSVSVTYSGFASK
jgi:hypothetical protein